MALATLALSVTVTSPAPSTEVCFSQPTGGYLAYFCALPVTAAPVPTWSGRVMFSGVPFSPTLADATATNYKVCRYATTQNPAAGQNASHPLDYGNVSGALVNQNYVVIRAGDGTTPFGCPTDDPLTPYVDGSTWPQQPAV